MNAALLRKLPTKRRSIHRRVHIWRVLAPNARRWSLAVYVIKHPDASRDLHQGERQTVAGERDQQREIGSETLKPELSNEVTPNGFPTGRP